MREAYEVCENGRVEVLTVKQCSERFGLRFNKAVRGKLHGVRLTPVPLKHKPTRFVTSDLPNKILRERNGAVLDNPSTPMLVPGGRTPRYMRDTYLRDQRRSVKTDGLAQTSAQKQDEMQGIMRAHVEHWNSGALDERIHHVHRKKRGTDRVYNRIMAQRKEES